MNFFELLFHRTSLKKMLQHALQENKDLTKERDQLKAELAVAQETITCNEVLAEVLKEERDEKTKELRALLHQAERELSNTRAKLDAAEAALEESDVRRCCPF